MKKYIYLDLFHLSLVLSLLRLYPNLYRSVTWDAEPYGHEVFLGDSTAYTQARFHNLHNNRLNAYIHPKNIDDAIEHSLFIHDVNSLCRRPGWNCNPPRRETNIFAYIVNELQPHSVASTPQENQESETSETQSEAAAGELTQADMDLIEVLWKQDIDMGVSREVFDGTWKPKETTGKAEEEPSVQPSSSSFTNPWRGLNYSIDSETGEHIVLPTNDTSSNAAALVPNESYMDITLEEALSLFDTDNMTDVSKVTDVLPVQDYNDSKASDMNLLADDFLLDPELPYTNGSIQNRTLLEQLQDLQELVAEAQVENYTEPFASVSRGFSNYNSTENNNAILDALLQNTTLALPMNETLLNTSYVPDESFTMEHDNNINALLSLLTNDTDPNPVGAVGGEDENDICPDLPMANLTVDNTLFSQFINEGSIDFTDFCDLPTNTTSHNDWPASTSSDSAVSSMGSDWSDSSSRESMTSSSGMWSPKNTSFNVNSDRFFSSNGDDRQNIAPPSPKKYHSFGKQQPLKKSADMLHSPAKSKYMSFPASPDEEYKGPSRTEPAGDLPHLAFLHNHTYHQVGDAVPDIEASQKPLERDKPQTSSSGIRGTRDEKRLRTTNLPLTVKEIVDLPIDRFNERLSQLNLAEEHLALIRDIRRRGKNKLAARTCRKRKVDQICELQTVLEDLDHKRDVVCADIKRSTARRDFLKQKYERLYRFIFPDQDPPEPGLSSVYFEEDSVVPPSRFPLCSSANSRNETEHKKSSKHKSANNK